MIDERDLTTRLNHEADQFFAKGGAPLEIGQVLDRAGEIRRGRRMRATMLMAACLVAVAVPTAMLATRGHDTPVQPAHRGNHGKVDSAPLTLQGLDRGAGPGTGYLAGTTWHTPANDGVDLSALDGQINEVAPLGTGYLVSVATGGDVTAHYVDALGRPGAQEWPISGSLVVSDDGHVGAFVEPDGQVVTVRDDGTATDFMHVDRGTGFDAVAMSGTCSGSPDDQDPCAVWVQSSGRKPASWFVTVNAASTARTQYRMLADVRDHGTLAAGITEVHEDDLSTCSAVETTSSDKPGWTTCGHQMVAFSTDGKHVLAQPDGDGLGPTSLAVFDADKGTKVLDLSVADQGYVRQMIWEDNTHVLATIYQQGQWGIVRIGLDGSRQLAVPPVPAQDDTTPAVSLPIG